ncbi:hypothetical protein [Albidovulum aquaemixtae]|uniref:hypothetical protein n=1 Tax=Albidovulum aquaemixtae TaxID=1542388 RepID=UPI000D55A773|nr:hypothetical protein [Defluviimonas aquaemixtae]
MGRVLAAAGRFGRLLLVAGLLAGLGLPGLALAMRPWLPDLIALMIGVAALRIGPRQALGAVRQLPQLIGVVLAYQVALPIAVAVVFWLAGFEGIAIATALILMAAAPSISGSPNLTILVGGDPAPALRLVIIGTALLPLTVVPVFLVAGGFGGVASVLAAATRLMGVILLAASVAFLLRRMLFGTPSPEAIAAMDGVSAIVMAVVVVGLMSAVGPALRTDPAAFAGWLVAAFAANLGLQIAAALALGRTGLAADRTALSIIAGNRNIALFLVALPASATDPILLFIGCYQIPMYLTPILMNRFYSTLQARE